ncbi:hypothetical protein [Flavobacterium sp.]|uniref:hypothetical protein n=1 Tax=Flavobacterium sp. TaxID=239 RepID=UPI002BDCF3AB|nr:hypothetical protein [Flavobacterium sp.]HSD05940.1 hypothetical protein [Flavobacterium sp.]
MKNFWKFIVLVGLFVQLGFAHNANRNAMVSLQKVSLQKESNTKFSKESLSASEFVQPTISRGTLDLKHTNRVPAGIAHYPSELQSLTILRNITHKIFLSDQDIDRYNGVSILLFPFHYFW